jgi:hypothetical protein
MPVRISHNTADMGLNNNVKCNVLLFGEPG